MTLRLNSLFEINMKRILHDFNSFKKKKSDRKTTHTKKSTRNQGCNGYSDSSDDDYVDKPRTTNRNNAKVANSSPLSSHNKSKEFTDTESCSTMDTSNSEDMSSRCLDKTNGHLNDSEDSYKPSTSKQRTPKKNNSKKRQKNSSDSNSNSGLSGRNVKRSRKYKQDDSSDSETENGRKRGRPRKYKTNQKNNFLNDINQPSTSRSAMASVTDHSYTRHLRSKLQSSQAENDENSRSGRPTRLNSRKSYSEQQNKSDEVQFPC